MKRDSFFDKFLRRLRCKKVIKYIPKGAVACDIGCGCDAGFLKKISPFIKEGIGLDKEVADSKNTNLRFKKIKVLDKLPLDDETFDVVTMIAIVEHFDRPQKIFNEVFRVLKPGGKLIITTPTPLARPILDFLSLRLGLIDKNEIKDHKNYFWPKDIKTMFVESGFREKNIKNYFFECYLNSLMIVQK